MSTSGGTSGGGSGLQPANNLSDVSSLTTSLDNLAQTVTSGSYLRGNGTHIVMATIVAGDVPTLNQNTTGTANNVTGTVAIANGGTGQTTQAAAIDALTGTQAAGKFLRSDGTHATLQNIAESDVTNLVTDLALKAPLASPTFTGTVVLPAQTVTRAMIVNAAANSFIGNNTGSAATEIAMTVAQAKSLLAIAESDVTNLVADLALKAPIDAPTFTGLVTVGRASAADGTYSAFSTALTSASAAFTSADVGRPIYGLGIASGTTIASVTNATTIVLSQITLAASTTATLYIGGLTGALVTAPNVLLLDHTASSTDNTTNAGVSLRRYANQCAIQLQRVDGTPGAGTPIANADVLGLFQFSGSTTTAAEPTIFTGADIRAVATEAWSGTAGGTQILFRITANTTHTAATALTLDQDKSATFAGAVTCSTTLTATGAATMSSTVALNGAVTMGEAINIVLGTTTGTKIGTATTQKLGFYNKAPVVQQTDGAALTNNVTTGGTTDTIANFTDLTTYANDSAAIRNDLYQLARKLKIVDDALRLYGLLS